MEKKLSGQAVRGAVLTNEQPDAAALARLADEVRKDKPELARQFKSALDLK